ncbi:MAG: AI-2E family transporter, partial [Allobaculum sp.]|nr:AI-2E family transporter [Allobaculum sp.]
ARTLALTASFLVALIIIMLVLSIIIPNMINAIKMLTHEAPSYFNDLDTFFHEILKRYPYLEETFKNVRIDWSQTTDTIINFITKGSLQTNVMSNTMNIVSSLVGGVVNLFLIIVFASYVLSDKERFVKGYYTLTDLFIPPERRVHLTRNLRIINQSFKAFIMGEILEACILSTMCIIGMLILRLPYATMIGILVGVINMIPMVGAFIGGGIGAFIIFTVSPSKCLIFLIFLCIIQQIESNIFFPKVVGNKVGLPGIFVMMTIVIGGSLFGVLGMILGVPLVASLYKIFNDYLAEVLAQRETKRTHLDVHHQTSTSSKAIFPTATVSSSAKITMEGPIIAQGSSKELRDLEDESQELLKLIHGDH